MPAPSMRAAERGAATRGQRRQWRQVPAGGTGTGIAGTWEGWRTVERMEDCRKDGGAQGGYRELLAAQ